MDRNIVYPWSELIDMCCVAQIKQIETERPDDFAKDLNKIRNDIDAFIEEHGLSISADMIYTLIQLSQINVRIWKVKENMMKDGSEFLSLTKLGHQLNGIRNLLKQELMKCAGFDAGLSEKTNTETDGLIGV